MVSRKGPNRENSPKKERSRYVAPPPGLAEMLALKKRFNQTGTEFLKVDLSTAMTFVSAAHHTSDPVKRQRNRKAARSAYDTVVRMAKKLSLSDADAEELSKNLGRLRSELVELGEVF